MRGVVSAPLVCKGGCGSRLWCGCTPDPKPMDAMRMSDQLVSTSALCLLLVSFVWPQQMPTSGAIGLTACCRFSPAKYANTITIRSCMAWTGTPRLPKQSRESTTLRRSIWRCPISPLCSMRSTIRIHYSFHRNMPIGTTTAGSIRWSGAIVM